MSSGYQGSLKGRFLIAMPFLADPNFHKTVTYICAHDALGALGIIINRQDTALKSGDIFSELNLRTSPDSQNIPIHIGGPVHMNELFILHGPPFHWEGCHQISESIAMSNTKDIITAIADGNGPTNFIISLGCAGWGGGQLEYELKENTWMTSDLIEDAVFSWPVDDRWGRVLRENGIDPMVISKTAGNA